ncbi:MAG: PatB family C-S lyase [Lentimicrobiaceae bacterium]|jgi:cystathionine beta-lyase|nr:PatB family C-S lyase [Lentimicrobiaceae bacterium]
MHYDFDKIIERQGTNSVKYDLRKQLFGSEEVLPMWVADMDFETPDFIRKSVVERANHLIYGYTFRSNAYYKSIVDWQKRHHNWKITKDWILFSPGIVAALNMIVLALTNPNDEIIVQPPVYFPFFTAVKNHKRCLVYNNLILPEQGYRMDFDLLEKQAKTAKMIILCNPHNPVGRSWKTDELQRLSEICIKNDLLIISDEIHCDLVLPPNKHTVFASLNTEIAARTITLHAASKTFNLAGLSTSSIIISDEKLRETVKTYIENLHVDMGNLFGIVATQTAFEKGDEWLRQLLVYVNRNVDEVCDFLSKHLPKIKVFRPEATYMVWLDFNAYGLTDNDIRSMLIEKAKLGFNSGIEFGSNGSGFYRMNLGCPLQTVKQALLQLKQTFESYE